MPSAGRLVAAAALIVVAFSTPGTAQNPLRPPAKPLPGSPLPPSSDARPGGPAAPTNLPRLRLGALLPLTGASAWYAQEIRQGMELAVGDLNPAARGARSTTAPATSPDAKQQGPSTARGGAQQPPASPTLEVVLEVLDLHPLNVKDAAVDFARLAATGVVVLFTASATPALTIYPLAASRDILVVHQGFPSDRFPATSQTLLQTRPSAASRGAALAAYAWERGIRRLALLAAGDEFGKAVRAALSARWRDRGASLVYEESLALEAPDLSPRLARIARLAPEAVCLAFRGPDLGDLARRIREAGYPGLLLALDDDPAALLAAGPTLADMVVLVDAFVPEPESRGARFAKAYEAKFKRPPSRFAANAYDTVTMITEGARAAFQSGRAIPGGARLREALLARRAFPSVYGSEVVIRDDGTFDRPLALFTVEGGRGVFVRYVTSSGRPATERSLAPTSGHGWASLR